MLNTLVIGLVGVFWALTHPDRLTVGMFIGTAVIVVLSIFSGAIQGIDALFPALFFLYLFLLYMARHRREQFREWLEHQRDLS